MADSGMLWTIRIGLATGMVFILLFVSTLIYYGGTRLIRAAAISEFVFSTLFVVIGSYTVYTITIGMVKKRMKYLDTIIESWTGESEDS